MARPSFDEIFMENAETWAKRSTCLKKGVGAVIAVDNETVSAGYNGAAKGLKHCTSLDKCPKDNPLDFCQLPHAEENAIVLAARKGNAVQGGTIYTTHSPCLKCAHMIINAGLKRVVYKHTFKDKAGLEALRKAKIEVVKLKPK